MSQPSITKICLKITHLKFHANFPGANELMIAKCPRGQWVTCGTYGWKTGLIGSDDNYENQINTWNIVKMSFFIISNRPRGENMILTIRMDCIHTNRKHQTYHKMDKNRQTGRQTELSWPQSCEVTHEKINAHRELTVSQSGGPSINMLIIPILKWFSLSCTILVWHSVSKFWIRINYIVVLLCNRPTFCIWLREGSTKHLLNELWEFLLPVWGGHYCNHI